MGKFVGDYSTGTVSPIIKKFKVGATIARSGILVMAPAAGNAGVIPCTTTAVTNTVGMAVDNATYSTSQAATSDVVVSVIVNPHAVYAYRMSGSAVAGVTLSNQDETTGSAGGTVVTTGASWTSTEFDEGFVWANRDGVNANMGQSRKITSTSATAGTVTVPFSNAIAIGDDFLRCPYSPYDPTAKTIQFGTLLTEADASIAVGTGAAMVTVDFILRGGYDSWVLCSSNDHVLNIATL